MKRLLIAIFSIIITAMSYTASEDNQGKKLLKGPGLQQALGATMVVYGCTYLPNSLRNVYNAYKEINEEKNNLKAHAEIIKEKLSKKIEDTSLSNVKTETKHAAKASSSNTTLRNSCASLGYAINQTITRGLFKAPGAYKQILQGTRSQLFPAVLRSLGWLALGVTGLKLALAEK